MVLRVVNGDALIDYLEKEAEMYKVMRERIRKNLELRFQVIDNIEDLKKIVWPEINHGFYSGKYNITRELAEDLSIGAFKIDPWNIPKENGSRVYEKTIIKRNPDGNVRIHCKNTSRLLLEIAKEHAIELKQFFRDEED